MSGLPDLSVLIEFTSSEDDTFRFDDDVLGLFDTGGDLGGGATFDVSTDALSCSIRRGQNNQLGDTPAGTCRILLDNTDDTYDPNNGPYANDIVPGRQIQVISGGDSLFVGRVVSWDYQDSGPDGAPTRVEIRAEDRLSTLARARFSRPIAWSEQTTSERIEAILADQDVAVPAPLRSTGAAGISVQADSADIGDRPLEYVRKAARAEIGLFFVARDGVVTYFSRQDLPYVVTCTITDDPSTDSELSWSRVRRRIAGGQYNNRVIAQRRDGVAYVATKTDAEIESEGGPLVMSRTGLELADDLVSELQAGFLLEVYGTSADRIVGVDIDSPTRDAVAERRCAMQLEIGDVLVVEQAGRASDVQVLGVSHSITFDRHEISIEVLDLLDQQPFIFDDDELGIFDDGGVLVY